MKRLATSCAAILAYSALGCAAVLDAMRPDFVEATTEDAAILTITQAPRAMGFLSAVRDPVKCQGPLDLGGPIEFEGERKVRLPPDKDFAFAVEFSQDTGFVQFSCVQMVVFTPQARAEYRARVHVAREGCAVKLQKVVAGVEVAETSARWRKLNSRADWKCED